MAGAGVACSVAFPFDDYGPGGPAGPDAGDGGTSDAADAFTPGCALARAPARPAADDPGGKDTDLTFAIGTLVIGLGATPTPGLDVDGLCTCPDIAPCVSSQRICDRDGGVDNAFDDLLLRFGSFGAPIKREKVQSSLDSGQTTVLMVVRRYNGLLNDTSVDVGLMTSLGTMRNDAGDPTPPRNDGTDEWTVDPSSVGNIAPPFVPKAIATEAYVSGGVLVAHGSFVLALGTSAFLTITLDEGTLTGRLLRGPVWRITDGRLAGRWPTRKLLTSLAVIPDPIDKARFLCGDSGTYQAYKPQLCSAADIGAAAVSDSTGKKCDALSIGLGFEAVQARVGPLAPPRTPAAGCGPDWQDDCVK